MPLSQMPLPTVKHTVLGTFIGSHPMLYTIVDFSLIGAAIWPGVGALAHGNIAHKFSLSEKFTVFFLHSTRETHCLYYTLLLYLN